MIRITHFPHEEFSVTFGRIVGFEFKAINGIGIGARYGIMTGVVLIVSIEPVASLSR